MHKQIQFAVFFQSAIAAHTLQLPDFRYRYAIAEPAAKEVAGSGHLRHKSGFRRLIDNVRRV